MVINFYRSMAEEYVKETFSHKSFLAMHIRPKTDACIEVRGRWSLNTPYMLPALRQAKPEYYQAT